jgi:hypothetical protein
MAFSIIGSSISSSTTAKVLQRQNFNKEPNGLETIIEAYAIKTENRDSIVPNKDTVHSAFSSSVKTYERMVVESVTTEEMDGGITQMLVTYVGLTSESGLPPAIVRLIPTTNEGVYGPPAIIEIEYITDRSETQYMSGLVGENNGALPLAGGFISKIKMPQFVNGVKTPVDPQEPFFKQSAGLLIQYDGYCLLSKACEKRGLFLVARDVYHESQQLASYSAGTLK